MSESKYLQKQYTDNNRLVQAQVVFFDICSYSKRRSANQTQIVDAFMACLKKSLVSLSAKFVEFAQANEFNFSTDIITLPTGDGAAVVLPFDGLPDAHLQLACEFLKDSSSRKKEKCERFGKDGWCNCHDYFDVTIGIAEGRGILYRDLNNNFNLAGDVINMAARAMGHASRNQILFNDLAYKQLIDLASDAQLVDKFRTYPNIRIKHDLRINLHQYFDIKQEGLNSNPAMKLELEAEQSKMLNAMGMANPASMNINPESEETLKMIKGISSMFGQQMGLAEGKVIDES